MFIALMIIGCIVAFIGFSFVTDATLGVFLAAIACFLIALSRVFQAAKYHKEISYMLGAMAKMDNYKSLSESDSH